MLGDAPASPRSKQQAREPRFQRVISHRWFIAWRVPFTMSGFRSFGPHRLQTDSDVRSDCWPVSRCRAIDVEPSTSGTHDKSQICRCKGNRRSCRNMGVTCRSTPHIWWSRLFPAPSHPVIPYFDRVAMIADPALAQPSTGGPAFAQSVSRDRFLVLRQALIGGLEFKLQLMSAAEQPVGKLHSACHCRLGSARNQYSFRRRHG